MDPKIRIYFFPRDASRVRAIVFSRRVGLGLLLSALPLCFLGFWLVATGKLREDDVRKFERGKLEREASALNEKTELLQNEMTVLKRNLDSLESVRIGVTLSSGMESQREEESDLRRVADRISFARASRLSAFVTGTARARDFTTPLTRVRTMSRFLDSTLIVLSRDQDLASRLPTLRPVTATAIMTRGFGPVRDPFTGRKALHAGSDFSLPPGAPVRAAGGGRVIESGQDPLWGYYVRIRHTDRAETFYAHLYRPGAKVGRTVARGEIIGLVGQSGTTTGPHLHFEMSLRGERVDPMPYLIAAYGTPTSFKREGRIP